MKNIFSILSASSLVLASAGCGGVDDFDSTTQAVRNGAIDTTHTNVVRIVADGGLCSGVVVSPTTVLTAAHCVEGVTPFFPALVQVNGVQRVSSDVEVHPQYVSASLVPGGLPVFSSPSVPGGFVYASTVDLGLIHFSSPLAAVTPAPLDGNFGSTGTLVGYGQNNDGPPDGQRRSGTVNLLFRTPSVTVHAGVARLSALASNLHASAGAGGTLGCPGDSGGPILNSSGEVIAILAAGDSEFCSGATVISTTHVSAYTSWILGGPLHQNPVDRFDVDNDGFLAPKDVLNLVLVLNNEGAGPLTGAPTNGRYLDVNGDGFIAPNDVLHVLIQINSNVTPSTGIAPPPINLESLAYTLEGDANQDGCVDLADFSILSANYGNTVELGPEEGDFNLDDVVDLGDFGILSGNIGSCL